MKTCFSNKLRFISINLFHQQVMSKHYLFCLLISFSISFIAHQGANIDFTVLYFKLAIPLTVDFLSSQEIRNDIL